jgi:hypothetical protein
MVSARWLSASCVVLMCATAAAASAHGISTGPTRDQLQQLTSRRQLRNLHWVRARTKIDAINTLETYMYLVATITTALGALYAGF